MADISDDSAHSQFLPEFQTSTFDAGLGHGGGGLFHRRKGLAAVRGSFLVRFSFASRFFYPKHGFR